jgi:hypothetical protein
MLHDTVVQITNTQGSLQYKNDRSGRFVIKPGWYNTDRRDRPFLKNTFPT